MQGTKVTNKDGWQFYSRYGDVPKCADRNEKLNRPRFSTGLLRRGWYICTLYMYTKWGPLYLNGESVKRV